jgi:hypothetical protein
MQEALRRTIMSGTLRLLAVVAAGGAVLVAPGVGHAHHKAGHTRGPKDGQHTSQRCKKAATNVGFVVRGTLTSFTADDPATAANEASMSITVSGANRHAGSSGELRDTDASAPGTQVKGGPFSVSERRPLRGSARRLRGGRGGRGRRLRTNHRQGRQDQGEVRAGGHEPGRALRSGQYPQGRRPRRGLTVTLHALEERPPDSRRPLS